VPEKNRPIFVNAEHTTLTTKSVESLDADQVHLVQPPQGTRRVHRLARTLKDTSVPQHEQSVIQSIALDVIELAPELGRGPPLLTIPAEDLQNYRPRNDRGVINLASITLLLHGKKSTFFSV